MTNQDRTEFEIILIALAEIHDKTLSPPQLDLYFNALADFDIATIRKIANNLAKTSKFFPKPADFREQILPNLDAQASLAWDKLYTAFINAGVYRSVVFDDPIIHAVLNSLDGGWIGYCNLSHEELKWYRKDFERLYKNYAPLVLSGRIETPKALPGLHEKDDKSTNEAKTPVFIGDKQKYLEALKELTA